jgi:aryl-alcohol dehydrogenase-like predicted oxidoreductase
MTDAENHLVLHATPEGTTRFHAKAGLPPWAVREVHGLRLAAIGLGTYIGQEDAATDELQENAIVSLLAMGCNVIDCAPNYRSGRAEICVGRALRRAIENGSVARDEIFVATKVGLATEGSALAGHFPLESEGSCYEPKYVWASLQESLGRLGLTCVDCVFIHNLEVLRQGDPTGFARRFGVLAEAIEEMTTVGLTKSWGISSWHGFRVETRHPAYLRLGDIVSERTPNLRHIQFPLGLWGVEALTGRWQDGQNILNAARGLGIFVNSTLAQGELATVLSDQKDIERAVCFVRDTPGVDVVLLGLKSPVHIQSYCTIQRQPPQDVLSILAQKI